MVLLNCNVGLVMILNFTLRRTYCDYVWSIYDPNFATFKMGIQAFRSWLLRRYPLIRCGFRDISRPIINNLYIDFTHILYLIEDIWVKPNSPNLFINEALRRLDDIIQMVRPTGLIFIAMDGTPPMNKVQSQRSHLMPKTPGNSNPSMNYYAFVAGSEFMDDLHSALKEFLLNKSKLDPAWMNPQIVYSSVYQPGEAEHKILEFIRSRSKLPEYQIGEVNCVMTTDSDLIPLIMLTPEANFLILAPKYRQFDSYPETESDYELLYINILREFIEKEFVDCDPRTIFEDWAILLLFLGNDFASEFPNMGVSMLPHLMESYINNIASQHKSLLNKEKELNLQSFYKLLKGYYANLRTTINFDNVNTSDDDQGCKEILDNFNWILKYYFDECPSWSFSQKRRFNLSVDVLMSYFKKNASTYRCCKFDKARPLTPFERLLATYSPKRGAHIPAEVVQLANTELHAFYPIASEKYIHILPYETLIDAFSTLVETIKAHNRNRVRDLYLFQRGQILPVDMKMIKQHCNPNLWIPSINRIVDFFSYSCNELTAQFCDQGLDINTLSRNLVGKIILVDYPYLKPLLVERIVEMSPKNYSKLVSRYAEKQIIINTTSRLVVVGSLFNFSSTQHISIRPSTELKAFPYCLTAPLLPELQNTLTIFNVPAPIAIYKSSKVIVMKNNRFHSLAQIIQSSNSTARIELLSYADPPIFDQTDEYCSSDEFACEVKRKAAKQTPNLTIDQIKDAFRRNPDPYQKKPFSKPAGLYIQVVDRIKYILSGLVKFQDKELMILKSKDLYEAYLKYFVKDDFFVFPTFVRVSETTLNQTALVSLEYQIKICHQISTPTPTGQILDVDQKELFRAGDVVSWNQEMTIGARVISIGLGGPIPPYEFGTVVGLDEKKQLIIVLLDNEFQLGSTLRRRLRTNRGIIAKFNDFLVVKYPDDPTIWI